MLTSFITTIYGYPFQLHPYQIEGPYAVPAFSGLSEKNAAEVEIQYGELRKTFNANLRANCSTCTNVQCCDNENLSTGSLPPVTRVPHHPEVGPEAAGLDQDQEPAVSKANKYLDGQQLTSAGLRKLSKNWETCLCRIQVFIDLITTVTLP